jgi:hypothetical protein
LITSDRNYPKNPTPGAILVNSDGMFEVVIRWIGVSFDRRVCIAALAMNRVGFSSNLCNFSWVSLLNNLHGLCVIIGLEIKMVNTSVRNAYYFSPPSFALGRFGPKEQR